MDGRFHRLSIRLITALLLCATAPCAYTAEVQPSPAEQKINEARKFVAAHPERAEGYNALATALARRARETSEVRFYGEAEEALAKSFSLSPDNLEGRKARVWLRLGRHEFAAALEEAQAVNRLAPDDVLVYGYLVDANIELGNYAEAERAAQWMLDLRPGNVPALTRTAYLRELFGDIDGAIDLMDKAYQRTAPAEVEDRAWISTQLAHLQLARGHLESAESLLDQALGLFPDYHYAVATLAQLRAQQKRFEEAIQLRRKHYALAPHAENLFYLGEALARAGQRREAREAFGNFEKLSLAESAKLDNSNHELVFYYVDYAGKPDKGLAIARLEAARRQDTHTLDAFAWALSAAGHRAEAKTVMARALEVGIRDAAMLYRAGAIERRGGADTTAIKYFQQSLSANAHAEVADAARRAVAELSRTARRGPATSRSSALP